MGLVQASKNPFKSGKSPVHLGELVMDKIMPKHRSELEKKEVSLFDMKRIFEEDIEKKNLEDAVGFEFSDFANMFDRDQIKGMDIENMN